ncbi:MAG TPA: hypothetical protein VGS05_12430 [Candidatus Sulfotelmatobacter sp.]|nr:hypothetical protein [Candidatus Sulfotelmatobacter sp.]
MKSFAYLLMVLSLFSLPGFAMKNRQHAFRESCDVVWDAAVGVAKSQDYRIVGISKEDQVLSLAVGGVWAGERIISLSLSSGPEGGCVATAQSAFSGLAHSDGPDLLSRIVASMVTKGMDPHSKAVRRYKGCLAQFTDEEKCEARLRKDLAKESAKDPSKQPSLSEDWWQNAKPVAK